MDKLLNGPFRATVFAAFLFLVAGCTAATPPSLVGTWVETITESESASFHGQWEMTFADDGRFTAVLDGKKVVEGHYTLAPDQLAIADESGDYASAEHPTSSYKPSIEKDTLTLTAIKDEADDRRLVLTLHPWSRKR